MKIEIDTSMDSKEELKKLITMLQAIVNETSGNWGTNDYSGPSEMVGLGFMDPDNAGSSTTDTTTPSTGTQDPDKDDEIPKIEMY